MNDQKDVDAEEDPLRISIFPHDQRFILIYVPEGDTLDLPVLTVPFTRASVSSVCAKVKLKVRLTEDFVGRHMREIMQQRKKEMRAENNQKHIEQNVRVATMHLRSPSVATRDRAALMKEKLEVDACRTALKAELSEAKSKAFLKKGYMNPVEFHAKVRLDNDLKLRQQSLQIQLVEVNQRLKAENIAATKKEDAGEERAFIRAAQKVLDRSTYLKIWSEADRNAEDEGGEDAIDALAASMEES